MNNKIKSISHRSFGFRTAENFIAAIYHSCARLPPSANCTFGTRTLLQEHRAADSAGTSIDFLLSVRRDAE